MSRTRCGSTGPTEPHADALGLDERDVVVHPALVALRVELLDQHDPRGVSLRPPLGEQRLEARPVRRVELLLVGLAGLDQDVEVAHGAEVARDLLAAGAGGDCVRFWSNASPNTRHAARWRRVATRIPWSSSRSVPSRVPASRATIRARWNRRTLRPASAR